MKIKGLVLFFSFLSIVFYMPDNSILYGQTYRLEAGTGGSAPTSDDVIGVYIQSGTINDKPYYIKISGNSNPCYVFWKPYAPNGFWNISAVLNDDGATNLYYYNFHDDASKGSTFPVDDYGVTWSADYGKVSTTSPPVSYQNSTSNITFTNGTAFTPDNGIPGTPNNQIGRFQLTGSSVGGVLQSVTISLSGTYSGINTNGVKLWSSSDNVFNPASDGLLSSKSNAATITFNNFNNLVDNTTGTYYFITVDLAAGATGNISLTIPSQASFTFVGANNPGAFTNASLSSVPIPLPVEFQSFTATPKKGKVLLNWSTATEVNNYGFQVQRKKDKVESEWEEVGFVEGSGNSNSVKEYSFTDNSVINGKYSYRLKQIDTDGAFEYSNVVEVVVKSIPEFFSVAQNFPNPGNPTTNINFSLPKEGHVVVKVYDILGKEISTLLDETRSADNHSITWNGLDGSGKEAASGIYLYNISFDGQSVTKKMLLVR